MPESPPRPADRGAGTRDRLVAAMGDALQRRGLHGVGLAELLAVAGAPKGVLYHHFPGGKSALAVAAIEAAVQGLCKALDALLAKHAEPQAALQTWLDGASRRLSGSGFERGCPLAAVALESSADDPEIRQALATGFATLRGRIATAFEAAGYRTADAAGIATLIVAAYEGGLIQARVAQRLEPMRQVGESLALLLSHLPRTTRKKAPHAR